MCTNSYCNYFCYKQDNLVYVESSILKSQAKIYQAAQICARDTICKEYNAATSRKDVLLLIARNTIRLIKKKLS